MPIRSGETTEAFETRLRADWQTNQKPVRHASDMSEAEFSDAVAKLSGLSGWPIPQLPPHLADKHVSVMTLDERRLAARILGINSL